MQTFTYQSKLFVMMRNVLIALFLVSTFVFSAQVWTIAISNGNSFGAEGVGAYNYPASIYSQSASVTGGLSVLGTGIENNMVIALCFHEFGDPANNSDIWIDIPNLTGSEYMLHSNDIVSELVSHATLSSMSNYPADDWTGNMTAAIHTQGAAAGWDPATYKKITFAFDLDIPEIENAVISVAKTAPFNQSYPHYAKDNDVITVSMTTDETITAVGGDIQSQSVDAGGLNSTSPTAAVQVTSAFDEGSVTFSVDLMDINGNLVSLSLPIPNSTSVIIDLVSPNVSCAECYVTLQTAPDEDYYAKSGDNVKLEL